MIINFISGRDLGGPKQSFVFYAKILKKLHPQLICIIRKGALLKNLLTKQDLDYAEVNYYRTGLPSLWPFKKTSAVKTLQSYNPKLIFVHKTLDIKWIAKALPNTKIIGIVHSFQDYNLQYTDAVIAVSEKVKQFLIKKNCTKPIYVVPNIAELGSTPKNKALPDVPLIGSMGVFRRTKAFSIFIKAMHLLKKDNVQFKAVLVGKGQLYYYYKYLICKYQLQNHLQLKSWLANNQREAFLDSLDLYICPSKSETFGMALIEAMSRMKRVISTRCGGPEEIIIDSVNGYLVNNQDAKHLADKVKALIQDSSLSKNIPDQAYQSVVENYSSKTLTQSLKKLLDIYL